MAVTVADGTARWWAAQWGPDGGESEEGYVALRLDRPTSDADLAALDAALDRVNDLARTRWLDLDDMPTIGRNVVRAGDLLVWEVATQHPDGPVGWLDAIAADLTDLGWTGRITTWEMPQTGRLDEVAGQRVPSAMVAIAWAGAGRYGPHPTAAAKAPWRADDAVIPVVVDLTLDILTRYGPGQNLVQHGGQSIHPDHELRDLLTTALRGDRSSISPVPWVHRTTPQLNIAVTFDAQGHVLVNLHAPPGRILDLVRDLTGFLTADPRVEADWMLLLENGGGTAFAYAYELARGTKLPSYYRHRRFQDTQVLPDAFGWQVITDDHLAHATDLTGWHLTHLDNGRNILQAPRLEDWLLPDPAGTHHLTIAPGALDDARLRFGALIHPPD